MIEFALQPENYYFSFTLGIMLGIAALEIITTFLGFALSGIVDSLMPDCDFDAHVHVELDMDNAFSKLLSWIRFGKVPIIMLMMIFLTSFSMIGFGIQSFAESVTGSLLSAMIAGWLSFFMSVPILHTLAVLLERYMPNDETDAVHSDSFINRIALLTTTPALPGKTVEAKVIDEHGNTHYIMIKPDGDFTIPLGAEALLISKDGNIFKAIVFAK